MTESCRTIGRAEHADSIGADEIDLLTFLKFSLSSVRIVVDSAKCCASARELVLIYPVFLEFKTCWTCVLVIDTNGRRFRLSASPSRVIVFELFGGYEVWNLFWGASCHALRIANPCVPCDDAGIC